MTDETANTDSGGKGENLPAGLRGDLAGLYGPPAWAGRDAEILAAMRRRPRRWPMPMGVAAAVLVAAGLALWARTNHPASAPPAYARTGDIRDAFYLDRQLHAHAAVSSTWDVNHDGAVDEKDVRSLALAAVQIRAEGGVQ